MTRLQRWLVLLLLVELLGGGLLIARRLSRAAPPVADWSLMDPATTEEIRTAITTCMTATDWRNLGELYMAAGFFTEAEMCHRVACELAPRNALLRRQWAFALERLGLLEEANTQYQQTLELSRFETDDCRYFMGRNLLRLEKPDEARKYFEDGKALSANLYELARLQYQSGKTAEASASLAKLIATGPELLQVNLLGYRLALERGDTRKAFDFADRVRYAPRKLQNPFDAEAERLVTRTQQLGPGRLWTRGRELIENNQLVEAQALLESLPPLARSSSALELLAEIALQQGRFAEANQLFEELQKQHGPFARISARMGDVWAAAGQWPQAREAWRKAAQLQTQVDLKATHHKLADSFQAAGEEAVAKHHRARGHFHVGRELLQFGHVPQAVDYFAEAAELDPSFTQAWFYLGETRRLSGKVAEARTAYKACLKLNPHHGRALANLGMLEPSSK